MSIRKRPARPTAASESDPRREPNPSDNDFTVLFERVPAQTKSTTDRPVSLAVPVPKRADARAERAARAVDTVNVRTPARTRILRNTLLLAIGCSLGIWVEVLGIGPSGAAGERHFAAPSASEAKTEVPDSRRQEAPAKESLPDKAGVAHAAHHHHRHHTSTVDPAATAQLGADGGDDVAAAVKALTQAQKEITLP
jgi:hypothetical protein